MMIDKESNPIIAYRCVACGDISGEKTGEPLYKCIACGTDFPRCASADGCSHRCPTCYKFAPKIANDSCRWCGGGAVEAIECYFHDETGIYIPVAAARARRPYPIVGARCALRDHGDLVV
ncbi:MAG: hypothetical protein M3Z19_07495 [Chloroflexota bacterium]|nr:hypothetical protein [Chloroflexota bacterium]